MEKREIRRLVKGWYEKSRLEGDAVSKFVFLWICFNAVLTHESNKISDRGMIDWLKERGTNRSAIGAAFKEATASEVFQRNLRSLVALAPIEDPRGINRAIRINGPNDFSNIIEGIYRVRCNLFHGSKRADAVRDQKLIIVCSRLLSKWIGNTVAFLR